MRSGHDGEFYIFFGIFVDHCTSFYPEYISLKDVVHFS